MNHNKKSPVLSAMIALAALLLTVSCTDRSESSMTSTGAQGDQVVKTPQEPNDSSSSSTQEAGPSEAQQGMGAPGTNADVNMNATADETYPSPADSAVPGSTAAGKAKGTKRRPAKPAGANEAQK